MLGWLARFASGVVIVVAVSPAFAAPARPVGGVVLAFPVPVIDGQSVDAFTAAIGSVFDHSMRNFYCPDDRVVAFTGEAGTNQGPVVGAFYCSHDHRYHALRGWRKRDGTAFVLTNHYTGWGDPLTAWYDGHTGYDYLASVGTPVVAAADGTVSIAICSGPYGCFVVIDHASGYQTLYGHLRSGSILVVPGQTVAMGTPVGGVGCTGHCLQPHLHFEARLDGIPVDPYGWTGPGSDPYTLAPNVLLWG